MAKLIKRVGIVFLILVVTCLLLVSSMLVINVTENDGIVAVTGNKNNISSSDSKVGSGSPIPAIPTAEKEYILQGSNDEMHVIWTEANQYSVDNSAKVKVTLANDWIADINNDYAIATGHRVLKTMVNSDIIFDLNGYTIDKKVREELQDKGEIFYIGDNFTLIDSKYDGNRVNQIYEQYKDDKERLVAELKSLPFGKLKGGSSSDSGAINTSGAASGVVNIYGGIFTENYGPGGGAISTDAGFILNVYDCVMVENHVANQGGAIHTRGPLNMYGGKIVSNSAKSIGGAVAVKAKTGQFVMYGGDIAYNDATSRGGGLYVETANKSDYSFVMYDGNILKNSAAMDGGIVIKNSRGIIYDGRIDGNMATIDTAGIAIWTNSYFEMHGGEIVNNLLKGEKMNGSGAGGMYVGGEATMIMYGGKICNNKIESEIGNVITNGAGINISEAATYTRVSLKGGIIADNTITNPHTSTHGAGIGFYNNNPYKSVLEMGGALQIYNNTVNGEDSDVYLPIDFKINIIESMATGNNGISRIGIDLADNYTGAFTKNYGLFSSTLTESYVFFSNHENEVTERIRENGVYDIGMKEGANFSGYGTWKIVSGSNTITSNSMDGYVELPYVEDGYLVTFEFDGKEQAIWGAGNAISNTQISIQNVGTHRIWNNTTTTLNRGIGVRILPIEVDVLWKNTELLYNGGLQKPTAYIAEDTDCKVEVNGEQIESGNHYLASAVSLSNSNYTIRKSSMYQPFSIAKVKLAKPFGNGSFEYDGSAQTYLPNGYNMVTMDITGNKATEVGSYNAVVSIKDKHNYEWLDGTNEDITLSYAITLAPPVNEETGVYRFIYLAEEGDKQVRKTYKESGLVHGINDSEVNGGKAVIGNIAPNTSVKEFIETLGFDTSKIVLKDNKGKDIYKNNAPVDSITYDNKYELAVGTGWRVEYTNNGNTETIYLSVLGDVTGDGRISAVDVTYLRQIANDKEAYDNLSVEKKLASLVLNLGIVTTADAEIIRNIMDGKISIDLFF